jgi:HD-GYP domain-containing protein (c-di-GMP phosphodiesterase class II)
MAILLIQKDVDIREKLAFSLEATFGDPLKQAADFAEAIRLMKIDNSLPVTLIIYDSGSLNAPAALPKSADLATLFGLTSEAKLLICQDPQSQPSQKAAAQFKWKILSNIDRTQIIANVLRSLSSFADSGLISLGPYETDFCKIKTKLLLSVCPLKGDIYIRLSEKKFVKLFLEGDAFEKVDMEKYTTKKGVEYLYLKTTDVKEFIEKYNHDLESIVLSAQTLNVEEAAKVHESIYETAQELGKRLGFTEDVQKLAKSHVQITMKQIGRNPRLSGILAKIRAYGGEYLGAHSAITGYMACAIASHLEWGSELTFHKLTLAAFLHDIEVSDHKLAHCNTLKEAEALNYTSEQVAVYKNHTIKAAQIAQQFQEIPPDVDSIVMQHHERPDGSGFPRGLGHSYIAPLAMVFIVAHDMAQYFLDHQSRMDIAEFVANSRDAYKGSQFKKIIDAVEKLG